MRNEPHGSPSKTLKPPPGVVPGEPEAGLRGKAAGVGAGGLDAEALDDKITGVWATAACGEAGSGSGSGVVSERAGSAGAFKNESGRG